MRQEKNFCCCVKRFEEGNKRVRQNIIVIKRLMILLSSEMNVIHFREKDDNKQVTTAYCRVNE